MEITATEQANKYLLNSFKQSVRTLFELDCCCREGGFVSTLLLYRRCWRSSPASAMRVPLVQTTTNGTLPRVNTMTNPLTALVTSTSTT
jgi:hypothetical protein